MEEVTHFPCSPKSSTYESVKPSNVNPLLAGTRLNNNNTCQVKSIKPVMMVVA